MIQSIKKSIVMLLLVAAFTSCNQGPSLQAYYVNNETNPGFISVDVPTSLLNLQDTDMTKEQRKAYESVSKLNVLAFQLSEDNKDEYNVELEKVKLILNDIKYEELMRGSTSGGKFMVKFLGESESSIDELILLGSENTKGFVVARVLGDNMNAGDLLSLQSVFKDMDFDDGNLNGFKDFFK